MSASYAARACIHWLQMKGAASMCFQNVSNVTLPVNVLIAFSCVAGSTSLSNAKTPGACKHGRFRRNNFQAAAWGAHPFKLILL
jgi:hypothetical protein